MRTSPQRGFSLISAIFLLVVIAGLGTFAVTLSTTQHQGQAMEVMGARAYQAALAGIEWAAFEVTQTSGVQWPGCAPFPGQAVAVGGNLAGFAVSVSCTATSAVEGTSPIWLYDVSAVANTGGVPGDTNYVEQMATAKLANR